MSIQLAVIKNRIESYCKSGKVSLCSGNHRYCGIYFKQYRYASTTFPDASSVISACFRLYCFPSISSNSSHCRLRYREVKTNPSIFSIFLSNLRPGNPSSEPHPSSNNWPQTYPRSHSPVTSARMWAFFRSGAKVPYTNSLSNSRWSFRKLWINEVHASRCR